MGFSELMLADDQRVVVDGGMKDLPQRQGQWPPMKRSGLQPRLEWGFWDRSERDEKREAARALGVAVELRFLDGPYEELGRRVVARHASGGIAITEDHMEGYRRTFQPPTADELALYDAPLAESD